MHLGLIAALGVFAALLAWRFYPCPLYRNDDISHWGLVARHLLKYDAFPNADTKYVFFQSYPLGSAAFIYYIGKAIGNTEGIYLVAQELLQGILFLPVFAHIQENKRRCYPVALAMFLLLFSFFRNMVNLQVDLLLAFFGIGMAAAVTHYRNDWKKALPAGLIGMIAVVYVKNSGLFFALCTALLMGYAALRCTGRRSAMWKTVLLSFALSVGAYLLWMLHIRISYPAALDTKHAVSLTAYAAQAGSKGLATILNICLVYLKSVLIPAFPQACALAFMLGCAALLIYGCRKLRLPGFGLRTLAGSLAACIGVYAVWAVLVLAMYIFSMPEEEALRAASFYRYNGTGMAYMMGLTAILFFNVFGRGEALRLGWMRALQLASLGFAACFVCLCFMDLDGVPFAGRIFERNTRLSDARRGLIQAHAEYELPMGGTYLTFCEDDPNLGAFNEYYHVKYEFETTDIYAIAQDGEDFLVGTRDEKYLCRDATAFIAERIDRCDALLVMEQSELFEAQLDAFLESYAGDTPVIYTYAY